MVATPSSLSDSEARFLAAAIHVLARRLVEPKALLALLLRAEDRTVEEIAGLLECSPSTVEEMISGCSEAIAKASFAEGQ